MLSNQFTYNQSWGSDFTRSSSGSDLNDSGTSRHEFFFINHNFFLERKFFFLIKLFMSVENWICWYWLKYIYIISQNKIISTVCTGRIRIRWKSTGSGRPKVTGSDRILTTAVTTVWTGLIALTVCPRRSDPFYIVSY